jgi:hypothetical protein
MDNRKDVGRIPLSKGDTGRFILQRGIEKERVGSWTRVQLPSFPENVRMTYHKLSRNPMLESELKLADKKMELVYTDAPVKSIPKTEKIETIALNVNQAVSIEEAETYTSKLIDSFSCNPGMRELLEDARFFAGASTLGGAVGMRRARAQIKRFQV